MATITATATPPRANFDAPYRIFWETITQADTGGAVVLPAPVKHGTVVFQGTIDATLTLEGSADGGTTFVTLKDTAGNAISTSAAASFEFKTNVGQIRIGRSGGTTTDADVYVDIV